MNLAKILENLTARIPSPRRKAPVVQQSFASLKVGQQLMNRTQFYAGAINATIAPGSLWTVESVTDQGARARSNVHDDVAVALDRDWREQFNTAPKLRRGRKVGASPRATEGRGASE